MQTQAKRVTAGITWLSSPGGDLQLLLGLSLLLSLLIGEAIDRLALPRRPWLAGGMAAMAFRAATIAAIWLTALGLTARAVFALTATAVALAILVGISNIKRRYLREPLVFSDFALLAHFVRHPQLFYVSGRWMAALIAGVAVLVAAIAIWMAVEPRTVSAAVQSTVLLGLTAALAVIWFGGVLRATAARLVPVPDLESDMIRLGLLASLTAYVLAWRHASFAAAAPAKPLAPPYDIIIVIQAEAFIDLRRHGVSNVRLPAFDLLAERALARGLLEVPCQGAYTLRPESAVIAGLGFDGQGFDRYHPYLRPYRLGLATLPRRLSPSGWDSLFVHPHDGTFFRRHRAIPALGFAGFADERAFAGAPRQGPHVSDDAVATFLIDATRQRCAKEQPLFAYAVTMEAHDPYGTGRLPDEDDPTRQYNRHIENADRMLGRLIQEFDRGSLRTLLVFFGDHVPFLPSFADPFVDTRTDFVVAELGPAARRDKIDIQVSRPEHLYALIVRCAEEQR